MWTVTRALGSQGQLAVAVSDSGALRVISAQLGKVDGELVGMRREMAEARYDMRAIYMELSQRFEAWVIARDVRIEGLMEQIVEHMVKQGGLDPALARAETLGAPRTFFERITQWQAGVGPAGGAVEAALWAALDFIPGGTGVKLGLAVLKGVLTSKA
jgi:hypothetical protein